MWEWADGLSLVWVCVAWAAMYAFVIGVAKVLLWIGREE